MQGFDYAGVNADNVSHLPHIVFLAGVLGVMHLQLTSANHAPIATGQAHRFATRLVDQTDDVLLHLTGQYPLNHFHGFSIGHPHALNEFAFFT